MEPTLLSAADVGLMLSISPRTLWRLLAAGDFPQPIRWNKKLVRWHRADVEAYLTARREAQAARDREERVRILAARAALRVSLFDPRGAG